MYKEMTHLLNLRYCMLGCVLSVAALASAQVGNFDSINSYVAPLEANLAGIRSLYVSADGSQTDAPEAWISFSNNSLQSDQETGRFDWDLEWDSVELGYGFRKGDWRWGAVGLFQNGEVDSNEINTEVPDPAFGHVDHDGWLAGIFIGYNWKPFALSLIAGKGESDNDMDRSSDLGSTFGHSFSSFETESTFFIATANIEYELPGGKTLYPFARLSFSKVDVDGFEETGGPDRRVLDSFDVSEDSFELGVALATGQVWYAPKLVFSYWQDFSGDDVSIGVNATTGTDLGTLVIPSAVDSLFKGSVVVNGEFTPNWLGELSLDYGSGDSAELWSISGSVGYKF